MKNPCHLATLLVCLQTVLLKVPALAMKVTQPIKIIAERNNVTLKCAYNSTGDGKAQVFRVTVYRSKEEKNSEVCAASFNNSMEPFEKRDVLHCIGQPRRNSISIKFIGMNMSHSDWYFCKVEKMIPLPYTKATGNGTWIFIKPDVEGVVGSYNHQPPIQPHTSNNIKINSNASQTICIHSATCHNCKEYPSRLGIGQGG
ncbi:cytotoxic T-lymphocyte protein 4-like [Amblyraja radiata]|uniref:cytotoxic T-lymphocyte protein 4-like n=1 Tax=Amblyraja radiata TaxID=386614 RepID=UPI0014026A57|nr:cytotoxic T-lymphocyte protein 4-like [Amblyraja radiata]